MRSTSLRTSSGSSLLLIGVLFAAACSHGARRTMPSGSGGSGNSQGTAGSMGSGGSGAVNTDPPEVVIPPGQAGAGGAPAKMACADDLMYRPSYSPGYSNGDHDRYLKMAQGIRAQMSPTEKAEQLRGVFSGEGSPQWHDIQRSYDVDNQVSGVRVKGFQYRDGPRGLNLDAPDGEGQNRTQTGTLKMEHGKSTAFPSPVARGAAFDVGLEYRIGMAMGDELVAANFSMLLVPCVNILRHPFWGRAQETYGEDTYLLGRIGTGLAAGVQEYGAACAKHWAANNIERNRPSINSELDTQTLREVYGRHFEMIIQDGGVSCVMAAYNKVNDVKSTQNRTLLTTILRDEFKFKGLVISDWWAMPGNDNSTLSQSERASNAIEALNAGLDLEVPWSLNYRAIEDLVSSGQFSQSEIDTRVDRVLAQKVRFNAHVMDRPVGLKPATTRYTMVARPGTDVPEGNISNNEAHIAIAEEAALKSMVLLKNCPASNKACNAPATDDSNVLPIKMAAGTPTRIAVVGPTIEYCSGGGLPGIQFCFQDDTNKGKINFATGIRTGDTGSSRVNVDLAKSVSPFAGVCQAVGGTVDRPVDPTACTGGSATVTTATTNGMDVTPSVNAAMAADFVVVVVGLTPYNEGEQYNGNDRESLSLDGKDHGRGYGNIHTNLVNAIAALGKPMVVVIEGGSAVSMPWLNSVPAVVMAWYPGMVGGAALGKLLLGKENFSGKLPITWPADESIAQLPVFNEAETGTTRMDYFLGYRRFDKMNVTPLYPFGYGLSYSSFQYSNLVVPCSTVTENGVINVTVDVTNTSPRGGEETAMLFVSFPSTENPRRSIKELKGFRRVGLDGAGQTEGCRYGNTQSPCASAKRITIPLRIQDLKYYDTTGANPSQYRWAIQKGTYTIKVGPNAATLPLTDTFQVP
jgi:beta-glucosidase